MVISSVTAIVETNGPMSMLAGCKDRVLWVNVQFCQTPCRNGGPALRTTPARIYSKQDVKKRAVFSEFSTFDFSGSTCGGINLDIH